MNYALAILTSICLCGCVAAGNSKSGITKTSGGLATHEYRLDMEGFWPAFEKMTQVQEKINAKEKASAPYLSFNSEKTVQDCFTELLKSKGIQPTAVFLNDRLSEVLVRGKTGQCESVKYLLRNLNGNPAEVRDSR